MVLSTVASQQEGSGLEQGVFLCGVCMLSLCLCGFSLSALASSHSPKRFRLIDDS